MAGADRERIFARIRRSLGRGTGAPPPAFDAPPPDAVPPAQPPLAGTVVEAFRAAAIQSAAQVFTIDSHDRVVQWVRERAAQLNVQPRLSLAPDVAELFTGTEALDVQGNIAPIDSWGLMRACAGIAETGTVVSTSRDCASGMLFLVERLIVLIERDTIVQYQEDVWRQVHARFGERMPRAVNLISGPSRTADVEQTIQLGAHGPRWVDYLIIG